MYSVVLMACLTPAPEATGFGDIWAKHCFWESCLPARYGWVDCGPAYRPYYPASYTSCHGFGGHWHGCSGACHGCYSSCHGCYSSCQGCYGGCWGSWWGGAIHYSGCSGAYYSCYGGGAAGLYSGIGYAGFGAFGNYGMYGTLPVYAAPVYATPLFDAKPEIKPVDPKPEIKPVDPKSEIKPVEKQSTVPAESKASVVVRVPANSKVYIDNNLMHSTSTERTFTSPALEARQSYYYTIRVVMEKDGKEIVDVRQVTVRGGEVSRLDFEGVNDRIRPDDRTIVDSTRNPIK